MARDLVFELFLLFYLTDGPDSIDMTVTNMFQALNLQKKRQLIIFF